MRGVVVVVVLLLAVAQHAHGKALDSSEGPPLVSPLAFLLAERTGLKDRQGNPVLNKRYLPFVPNTTLHYKQTLQEFVQDQQDQQDQRRVKPPPVDRPAEGKYYLEATLKAVKAERESELLLLGLARATLAQPISDAAFEVTMQHALDRRRPDDTLRQLAERLAAVRVHTKVGMVPALVNWFWIVGMAFTAHYCMRTLPTLCAALLPTIRTLSTNSCAAVGAVAVWALDAAVAQLRAIDQRRRPTDPVSRSAV